MANHSRLESRKSLLGADPGFSQQGQQYQHQQTSSFDQAQNYDNHNYSTQTYENNYAPNYQGGAPDPYAQPSLQQPAYAENGYMGDDYEQGYAGREGISSRSKTPASSHHGAFTFMKSKWPAAFMGVTMVQAAICIAFEA